MSTGAGSIAHPARNRASLLSSRNYVTARQAAVVSFLGVRQWATLIAGVPPSRQRPLALTRSKPRLEHADIAVPPRFARARLTDLDEQSDGVTQGKQP